jgi:hypothetical protein
MALVDPVKIYAATSNLDAVIICRMLQDAGIEAFAGEDTSPAGIWMGGTVPGVFDAGVYVSRPEGERAMALIRQHELVESLRASGTSADIEADCEECGKTARFPAGQRGTVQNCPHCDALIDVGGEEAGEWAEEGEAAEAGEGGEDGIRPS